MKSKDSETKKLLQFLFEFWIFMTSEEELFSRKLSHKKKMEQTFLFR